MPIYEYKCSCGLTTEIIAKRYKPSTYITCHCGKRAKKIISKPNTDLVNNVRYSSAMGVNPRQIKEAEKRFPGSKYDSKGKLEVLNRKDKLKKAKERGLSELD